MVETKPKPRFEEKTEGGIEVVWAQRSSPDTQRTNPGKSSLFTFLLLHPVFLRK